MKVSFNVVGISFRIKDDEAVRKLVPNGNVELKHVPFVHPHSPSQNDPNAVQVLVNGIHIGYMAKCSNERSAFFEMKNSGTDINARVVDFSYAHYNENMNIIDGTFNDMLDGYLASVKIEFETAVSSTHYTIDGKDYLRTTVVAGMIDEIGFELPEHLYNWMTFDRENQKSLTHAEYLEKLNKVRADGVKLHDACEMFVQTGVKSENLPHGVDDLVARYSINYLSSEKIVSDKNIKVAGKYDLFAELALAHKENKGKRGKVIIDWKRGSKLRVAYMMQGAFYAKKMKADEFWIVLFGTKNKCGYSVKAFNKKDINKLYTIFASLAMVVHWLLEFNEFKLPKGN